MDFAISNDFVEEFRVSYTGSEVIINGHAYPAGYCACAALNITKKDLDLIAQLVVSFEQKFLIFISAQTPSSAASARIAMEKLWAQLKLLPGYRQANNPKNDSALIISNMMENEALFQECVTANTPRFNYFQQFRGMLNALSPSLESYIRNTTELLQNYFDDYRDGHRNSEHYAEFLNHAFAERKLIRTSVYDDVYVGMNDEENDMTQEQWLRWFDDEIAEVDKHYPMPEAIHHESLFGTEMHPGTRKYVITEQLGFHKLTDFLYTDFYRGLMAGHVPRTCKFCGRYFLLTDGYDTKYCTNRAPGHKDKTCRQVAARTISQRKAQSNMVQETYKRAANRLKVRKHRGKISTDEWNTRMALIQDVRDKSKNGTISNGVAVLRIKEYADGELNV